MKLLSNNQGQLLIEVLLAITALVIIVALSAQIFVVSSQSAKLSSEKNAAQGLVEETLEVLRGIQTEKWHEIYKPPDGTGNPMTAKGSANHYHPVISGTKWTVASGDEVVTVNNTDYTRYFYIDNVSRDVATRNIESIYNASNDDPSTQKITATVTWGDGQELSTSQYIMRWRNITCNQTSWVGGALGTPVNCPTTNYGSHDGNMDPTGTAGSLKLKAL